MEKYCMMWWDYHGHFSEDNFETASRTQAIDYFNRPMYHMYDKPTLFSCPSGFRTSIQTPEQAGYIEIA